MMHQAIRLLIHTLDHLEKSSMIDVQHILPHFIMINVSFNNVVITKPRADLCCNQSCYHEGYQQAK